jgi:hypothetical protein
LKVKGEARPIFQNSVLCPEFVQRGESPVLTSGFDFRARLFHTVFNRTVENFNRTFMIRERRVRMVGELLCRSRRLRGMRANDALFLQQSIAKCEVGPKICIVASTWYHPCLPQDASKPK